MRLTLDRRNSIFLAVFSIESFIRLYFTHMKKYLRSNILQSKRPSLNVLRKEKNVLTCQPSVKDDCLHHQSVSPPLLHLHHLCPLDHHAATQLHLVQVRGRLLLGLLLLNRLEIIVKKFNFF